MKTIDKSVKTLRDLVPKIEITPYMMKCLREFVNNPDIDGRKLKFLRQHGLIIKLDFQYILTTAGRWALYGKTRTRS